jgi:hypothetical protein
VPNKSASNLAFFLDILLKLEELEIPYVIIGGFAAAMYGTTRATFDIDMVVNMEETHIRKLADAYPSPRYYADPYQMRNAIRIGSSFNIIDAGREATIVVTLPAHDGPRPTRPALVSLGAAGQTPVFQEGGLADVADLIDQAWQTFGLQLELAAAPTAETAGDEEIAATDLAVPPPEPAAPPTTPPTLERPRNLSLF